MSVDKYTRLRFAPVLPLVFDDTLSYYEEVCQLVRKINEMIDYVNGVEGTFLEEAKAYTDARVSDILTESKIYADNLYDRTKSEYVAYVIEQINALKIYIDERDIFTLGRAQEYTREYTDSKLIDYQYMLNPITGKTEDVRDVLQSIIDSYLKTGSITAKEYDDKNITAKTYDDLLLSAYEYDFKAKTLLP